MTGPIYLLPALAERFGLKLQGVSAGGVNAVATLERAIEVLPAPAVLRGAALASAEN